MKVVILVIFALFAVVSGRPQSTGKQYPIKLQPELDNINVEDYLKNPRLVELQVKCVVHDGPCDSVGRWLKPRIPSAMFGNCLECTPKQTIAMQKIIAHLQEHKPEEFKAGIAKYLSEAGIGGASTASATSKSS